jgi:hypothetical protein
MKQVPNKVSLYAALVTLAAVLVPVASAEAASISRVPLAPGDILVIDDDAGTDSRGALFRVNPSTGSRTQIGDFAEATQGELGGEPYDLAIEGSDSVLITTMMPGRISRVPCSE